MDSRHANPPFAGYFVDRRDAGRLLAKALTRYRDQQPIVLALPRGGVPVGYEIARALAAPLDVLLVRKLGAPGYPELGMGAVVEGTPPQRVLNEHIIEALRPPAGYLVAEEERQLALIAERHIRYRGKRPMMAIEGRTVIVTDDGIATGGTMRAALKALAARARHTVLAVPVAPPAVLESIAAEADDAVCLLTPTDFQSVGFYYADFGQLEDEDVLGLLARPD
jgi:putative phosphoribosyl transferase